MYRLSYEILYYQLMPRSSFNQFERWNGDTPVQ